MDGLSLPLRTTKPRTRGLTSVHDVGIPVGELRNILADYGAYLDVAKFGIGSAYVTPRLVEKIELYREFQVTPHFGGTLFEKYFHQDQLDRYLDLMRELCVDWIEVSSGTVEIPLKERASLVERLAREFVVLSEVGCKDQEKIMPPSVWIEEVRVLLEAGSRYVITEGRDSGTAGVYRPSGEIRTGLVTDLASTFDPGLLIFEAPTAKAQMFFINLLGANTNLGNVAPRDVLLLEAQRQGLRNETFYLGQRDDLLSD